MTFAPHEKSDQSPHSAFKMCKLKDSGFVQTYSKVCEQAVRSPDRYDLGVSQDANVFIDNTT